MANLIQVARITFLLALLVLHTILFAKPSIEQYLEVISLQEIFECCCIEPDLVNSLSTTSQA